MIERRKIVFTSTLLNVYRYLKEFRQFKSMRPGNEKPCYNNEIYLHQMHFLSVSLHWKIEQGSRLHSYLCKCSFSINPVRHFAKEKINECILTKELIKGDHQHNQFEFNILLEIILDLCGHYVSLIVYSTKRKHLNMSRKIMFLFTESRFVFRINANSYLRCMLKN